MCVGVDAVEQRDHRLVRAHHLGAEVADAALVRGRREAGEEQRAEPPVLHVVDDRDRGFGDVLGLGQTDEARDPETFGGLGWLIARFGRDREVIPAVRREEPIERRVGEPRHCGEEPRVARFVGEAVEPGEELRPIVGAEQAHTDRGAVGEPARLLVVHPESHVPLRCAASALGSSPPPPG
jgi:hypothetical protein